MGQEYCQHDEGVSRPYNDEVVVKNVVISQESNLPKTLCAVLILVFSLSISVLALTPEEKVARQKEVSMALSETVWNVTIVPQNTGSSKLSESDTLTFENGTLKSQKYSEAGYRESNITITVNDDGTGIWETMQNSEGKGQVFWHGELKAKSMSGIINQERTDGTSQAFLFRAIQSGKLETPANN